MQTEWGIFQLRYFFTNAIDRGLGAGSDTVSQAAVTEIIREIINTEERRLSDQKIADMLKERGINIARRTVAKYRTRLDMDSSYKR
ncbi:hypothetical protein FACS189494_10090 [Spirochaetia bacterium]|nr:hypothetical protein FACS189494_10090 [Spirochaetia bacterium]